jgi:hypothetical protein
MRRSKKFLLIGMGSFCLIIMLLLAAALTPTLLANRDLVKSYIVTKTAQATGGHLDYERIGIGYLPLPHLVAQGVRLTQPEAFSLQAQKLAIYPRILAMLGGRLSIRRLVLNTPDIHVHLREANEAPSLPQADEAGPGLVPAAIDRQLKAAFGVLAAIDPQTRVEIDQGRTTVDVPGDPDIHVTAIMAIAERTATGLTLALRCSSSLIKDVDLQASVDVDRSRAEGRIALTDINPGLILSHLSLPSGITLAGTQGGATLDFTLDGTDKASVRFQLQAPTLGLSRGNRRLNLSAATLAGEMAYEQSQLSLRLDTIATRQPALDLSASAILTPADDTNAAILQLSAAAKQLDVAVVGDVARAIAGDHESIGLAFDLARAGSLVDPACTATIKHDQDGWHLDQMKATGRLSRGRVSIAGIHAEAENVAGKIVYADDHVDFLDLSGQFQGATFKNLDLAMDWANHLTWSMGSSSVDIEAAPFFTWLTDFDALTGLRQTVSIIGGRAAVSKLTISGPLTAPEQWAMEVVASPQALVLNTPQTPFDITLSGGEIVYRPGNDRSSDVGIAFLDTSLVASHQSSDNADSQAITIRFDGSAGPDTLAWLNTKASIPDQLQINPPVSLTGVNLEWNRADTISLTGELKTADGVALVVDLTRSPEELAIRELHFSDGVSNAFLSVSKKNASIGLSFSGNVQKETADRLLKTNQILTGNIGGDFKARIDTKTPLSSTFDGNVSGAGLHFPALASVPVTVDRFSVIGRGHRFDIQPSQVVLDDTRLRVNGTLVPQERVLIFDMNVDTDRLDVGLLKSFHSDEKASASADGKKQPSPTIVPRGTIHFKARSLTYGDFTWAPVSADIRMESDSTYVIIDKAQLCGISTTGDVDITPQGIGFNIRPLATKVSLQQTYDCLWDKHIRADARYDLGGNVRLEPTQGDPLSALSGRATFSSQNGRIYESSTLLKIFAVLNITELFTGGKSDLTEDGYGYSKAWVKARIEAGKLHLDEILLDGNALKLTGQGSIDLQNNTADITVLAAPLKTVDRVVRQIPIIRYITGGSLITVPLRLHGELKDLSVVPLPPAAVGKGLLNFMQRTLKAPFKLVEKTMEMSSGQTNQNNRQPDATDAEDP